MTIFGSQPLACFANSGFVVARSLNPGNTETFAQYGHFVPARALFDTVASKI